MSESGAIPNHVVNPATGFVESLGYASAFDSDRKQAFLKNYRENGLRVRRACRSMGLSESTVSQALRIDPLFKRLFDEVEADFLEELEATSKTNALNPKSVIERIFLMKCLLPDKYGQENKPSHLAVNITIDGKMIELVSQRKEILDVVDVPEIPQNSEQIAHVDGSSDGNALPK